LVTVSDEVIARDPFSSRAVQAPARHEPSGAQRRAIGRMVQRTGGDVYLLTA
jgi:hypothetical protein